MKTSAIILAALVFVLTPQAVARRCNGEFSAPAALVPCACTVRNRLAAGWNPAKVLSAYYAPDSHASEAQVQDVADVLSGEVACDPGLYFMYSRSDTVALGIEAYTPALVVQDGGREVRFYGRWFRRSVPALNITRSASSTNDDPVPPPASTNP